MNECPRLEIPGASVVMLAGKGDDGADAATADVLTEIAHERHRQVSLGYTIVGWATLITTAIIKAIAPPYTRRTYRHHLVQAAALCVAAIEALDRRIEQEGY